MGVPAPRSVHAKVFINGEYSGLYALTEQIDGRFTRYHFPEDGKGNLYKEVWPLTSDGNPQIHEAYHAALKTNEDENASISLISNFANEVASAPTVDGLKSIIEESMNLDEIISYWVVDRTIRHDDGPYHWYCGEGDCTNHNFYWYEESNLGQLHLIPWDLDNAFDNITGGNEFIAVKDKWGETSNGCQPFKLNFWLADQKSACCDKLIKGWASYQLAFEEKKKEFIEGPFSNSSVENQLNKWQTQIRSAVIEADNKHGDAISESTWQDAVSELKLQVEKAKEN